MCGQSRHVDPDIVVLEDRARLVPGTRHPLGGRLSLGTVRPVRLSPEGALPVARLTEQVLPGDLPIVLRIEELEGLEGPEPSADTAYRGDRRHVLVDGIVQALDQAPIVRQSHGRGEEALGDAERHVHPLGISPLSDDVSIAYDHPRLGAAGLRRTHQLVQRLAGGIEEHLEMQVVNEPCVSGVRREGNRLLHEGGIHPHGLGRAVLPRVAWLREVNRSGLGVERRTCCHEDCAQ